jgi:hypothetical protein
MPATAPEETHALPEGALLHPAFELPLVRFVQALHRCTTLDQLGRAFAAGFGRLMALPMYGFNVVHPCSTRLRHNADARSASPGRQDPNRLHRRHPQVWGPSAQARLGAVRARERRLACVPC